MAQNVDNAKWAGNVTVSPFSFTEEDNRLLISQSAHNFRVENRTTSKVGMRADYHHLILKRDSNGQYTEVVKELSHEGPITVPKKEDGEEYGLWTQALQYDEGGADWNPFRTWDFTGEVGASYMLDTYVAVRHGQGQAWGDDLFHARTKKLHL